MNPIDTDTLRKFLADESRNMLEGMTKGNLYMSAVCKASENEVDRARTRSRCFVFAKKQCEYR